MKGLSLILPLFPPCSSSLLLPNPVLNLLIGRHVVLLLPGILVQPTIFRSLILYVDWICFVVLAEEGLVVVLAEEVIVVLPSWTYKSVGAAPIVNRLQYLSTMPTSVRRNLGDLPDGHYTVVVFLPR